MGNTNPNQLGDVPNFQLGFGSIGAASAEIMRRYVGGDLGNFSSLEYPFNLLDGERVFQFVSGMATGVNDIYTCPAGKKFWVQNVVYMNHSGGSVTPFFQISGKGQVVFSSAVNANQSRNLAPNVIMEAGEILQANGTAGQTCIMIVGVLFDPSVLLSSNWVLNVDIAGKTVYEVPAGYNGFLLGTNDGSLSSGGGGFGIFNNSGGAVTHNTYLVPSGQSVGVDTLLNTQSVSNGSFSTSLSCPRILPQYSSIFVSSSSSTAGQSGFVTAFEVPI